MPTIPSVFSSIRTNDVQFRPFKAYKTYTVTNTSASESRAYVHDAIYRRDTPNIGDTKEAFPTNSFDNTNKYAVWNQIDHRFYRYPYDPARTSELSNIRTTEKFLYYSASILTLPYNDVGESIKKGSVTITATDTSGDVFTLADDSYGNLRDSNIESSSMADKSKNFFYTTFNNGFRKARYTNAVLSSSLLEYNINNQTFNATAHNVEIVNGISSTGKNGTHGLACKFEAITDTNGGDTSYIRIPTNPAFDQFGMCDDWTISFWHQRIGPKLGHRVLLSKLGAPSEKIRVKDRKQPKGWRAEYQRLKAFFNPTALTPGGALPTVYQNAVYPFVVGVVTDVSNEQHYVMASSDGASSLYISSAGIPATNGQWHNVIIRNSASLCEMFIDGVAQTSSGSLPAKSTANSSDITLGNLTPYTNTDISSSLAEVRFYNYAVTNDQIDSLTNRHYISGSCMQTNVVGNAFYRNGQLVVSSPLAKYNSGSGVFGNVFSTSYRGTHTLYENEVMIRVPAGQFNVSMNPSATYMPPSETPENCATDQSSRPPGELIKTMFTDGVAFPYITTIGLYNDKNQLLAIGKLAQPVQKRDDIDMNFIVRWDY